jgi:hypothetical protein
MRLAALALITALAGACGGQGQTPVARVSPSAGVSALLTPGSSPAAGLCDASHRCLALVTLRGSNQLLVRDVTDIDHPQSVATIQHAAPQFVSATDVSYADATGLYRAPFAGTTATLVAKPVSPIGLFAWSAAGTQATYLTSDGVHVVTQAGDRTFGQPLPQPAGGYGCESQTCADTWDSRLAFSPDGAFVSLVVVSGPVSGFKLWSSDGKLLPSPASQAPTMSVWSSRTLYYRDGGGVEAWRDGTTAAFLAGVQWIRPKGSPAGGLIVYELRDASGLAHVYTVDTATKAVRELKAGRREPAFLTSRYVWYMGERPCVSSDQCVTGPTVATGKTYLYDLQTGTEYESVITSVYDVWPHAA